MLPYCYKNLCPNGGYFNYKIVNKFPNNMEEKKPVETQQKNNVENISQLLDNCLSINYKIILQTFINHSVY